jgi:pimeloyl-ACP methyl ester carboxylesterase
MPISSVNGVDLYYRVDGDGPPIVLAHGRASTHLSWCQQVPAFADKYSVITYDARGFGQSTEGPGEPTMHTQVDDLEGLVDHLQLDGVVLVGQSMGGLATLQFAVRHPQRTRGLVLTSTPAGIDDDVVIARVKETRQKYDHLPTPNRVFRPGFIEREPALLHLWLAQQASSPPYPASFLDPLLMGGGPSVADLADLPFPTLVLTAQYDALVSPSVAARMCEILPRATMAVAEDCGHCVYWERPGFYNQTVRSFVEALP